MARLPQPGGDEGNWGDILNDYLLQSHNPDGTQKNNTIGASQLQDKSVTTAKLADDAVTKSTIGLANVDNTSDSNKPVSTAVQTALDLKQNIATLDSDTAVLVAATNSSTATAIDTKIAEYVNDAAEIQMAGIERGYAERTSTFTTTSATYPGVAIPGLAITVEGQDRPVDIEINIASAYHSVANTAVTALMMVNGAPLSNFANLGVALSPSTSTGPALIVRRRVILTAGTSYTFSANIYAGAAGTTTLVAATYAAMYISVVSR